jgi:hypothetical protein
LAPFPESLFVANTSNVSLMFGGIRVFGSFGLKKIEVEVVTGGCCIDAIIFNSLIGSTGHSIDDISDIVGELNFGKK